MPPDIVSSHLTSPTRHNHLVCCHQCGFGMAKILPPDSSRPTPVGKLSIAAMIFSRLAQVTMAWVKKWLSLWQSYPATLLKAILMGIAKKAYRVALAAAPWEKTEVIQINDEVHNLKDGHLEHLILNSLESLVQAGHLGENPTQLPNSSIGAKMGKMQLEESGQCLINSSISFDFGSHGEGSSEEDLGLDTMEGLEKVSQTWLSNCYNPQILTKSLAIGGYFGENSHICHRKMVAAEGSFCQGLGIPSGSWDCVELLEPSGDFATSNDQSPGEKSPGNSTVSPVCGKHLESDRKDEGALNLGASPISHGFQSSLVLSLFYSPSEDEEEEGSEDWWSEDEMEESHQSEASMGGSESGKEENPFKVDEKPLEQNVLEKLPELFPLSNNPFCLPCSSKASRVLLAPAATPSEPPKKEIAISFDLTKMDSKPKEFCKPPKHPWPPKDPRVNCRRPAHECHQSSSLEKCDPKATEMPSVSQEQHQVIKKVRFSPVVTIYPLIDWNYASQAARRGPWEEMARDRSRFSRRIAAVGAVLNPCLEKKHRANTWKKMRGDSLDDHRKTHQPNSSGVDKLRVQTK